MISLLRYGNVMISVNSKRLTGGSSLRKFSKTSSFALSLFLCLSLAVLSFSLSFISTHTSLAVTLVSVRVSISGPDNQLGTAVEVRNCLDRHNLGVVDSRKVEVLFFGMCPL